MLAPVSLWPDSVHNGLCCFTSQIFTVLSGRFSTSRPTSACDAHPKRLSAEAVATSVGSRAEGDLGFAGSKRSVVEGANDQTKRLHKVLLLSHQHFSLHMSLEDAIRSGKNNRTA